MIIRKIKVLIIEDSAVMRKFLTDVLESSPEIDVVATAIDPIIGEMKIRNLDPDVLTLDINLPRMDGITFLSKIMENHPMPVVMVTDETHNSAEETIKSLELGAVDFILKPKYHDINSPETLTGFSNALIAKIIDAGKTKIKKHPPRQIITSEIKIDKKKTISTRVIAIGASAGGVEIISQILKNLTAGIPGIVIAQHMPKEFTRAFAERLNEISIIDVKEADNNDRIYTGTALVAPGDRHLILRKDANGFFVEVDDREPLNRHKPSVDILFQSVAEIAGNRAIGIILTGMGDDGSRGLMEMKNAGAVTIAQDRESSIVFGMPKKAIDTGAAQRIYNVEEITAYLEGINTR